MKSKKTTNRGKTLVSDELLRLIRRATKPTLLSFLLEDQYLKEEPTVETISAALIFWTESLRLNKNPAFWRYHNIIAMPFKQWGRLEFPKKHPGPSSNLEFYSFPAKTSYGRSPRLEREFLRAIHHRLSMGVASRHRSCKYHSPFCYGSKAISLANPSFGLLLWSAFALWIDCTLQGA